MLHLPLLGETRRYPAFPAIEAEITLNGIREGPRTSGLQMPYREDKMNL